MRLRGSFLIYILLTPVIGFSTSCRGQERPANTDSETVFVGSTPGDTLIKSLLAIPANTNVDFIRWNLVLGPTTSGQNAFTLNIVFGEAEANTLGFKGGGEKRSFDGQYIVSAGKDGKLNEDIYHFTSSQLAGRLSMVKVTDNLLHLLTAENTLMIGNGGWSYSLNRKGPIRRSAALPTLTMIATKPYDTAKQVIFEGRTPCFPFAVDHDWSVSSDCIKLKWKLTLNKDTQSSKTGTYSMRRVINNEAGEVKGKWTLLKDNAQNSHAVIYQLNPGLPEKMISFLVGDENVIFLLSPDRQLYVGNSDFSFTLNKRE